MRYLIPYPAYLSTYFLLMCLQKNIEEIYINTYKLCLNFCVLCFAFASKSFFNTSWRYFKMELFHSLSDFSEIGIEKNVVPAHFEDKHAFDVQKLMYFLL